MLRTPQFWLMIVLFFAFGFVVTTINVHIVNHATDLHISSTAGAGILSIANGLSVVGSIIFGVIGDRLGNKRLFVYTFFVLAASLFSLLFLGELWMLNIFAVVFGLAFGSGLAQAPALVARFFGTATLGVIFGIISFCQTLGASLGSYLAGLIYDISQDYQLIFIICGILCLIGMTATALLKPLKTT
jgi:MFS family permease